MNKSIEEIEDEIVEEFSLFDEWMDKYEYIIELGKNLPSMDENLKTEDRKVSGCQSQVWLNTKSENGKVLFEADSDAIITKGLVGLLVRVLSGQRPEDVINAKLGFIDKIGMKEHLSPNRANGLVAMIKHMKLNASSLINKN
ncbi:MAG: SufE family protein [Ignavibacteriae bacterium]|nr:SufE family protein [Ignavibacteriota bacterium]